MLQGEFQKMQQEYGFEVINANQRVDSIQRELRKKIGALLGIVEQSSVARRPARRAR